MNNEQRRANLSSVEARAKGSGEHNEVGEQNSHELWVVGCELWVVSDQAFDPERRDGKTARR
jgi:hypothetical protein